MPTAGSQPDPALLLFSWTSRLQGTKGKRGSSSAASTQGPQAQDGEPSSLGRHQQAGLHPRASCSPRAMRRAEEDTHLGPGLAAPSLSLPEPHLTPRLPLRSLGNRNAPMTPRSVLAGSLLLPLAPAAVNIHEFPPWGEQVAYPCSIPVHCGCCPGPLPPGWSPPTLSGPQQPGSSSDQGLSKVPGVLGPRTQAAAEPCREPGTGLKAMGGT